MLFKLTTSDLLQIGPKGLEFGRYSLDYHTIRNYLYVNRQWGKQRYETLLTSTLSETRQYLFCLMLNSISSRADRHIPSYAKKIVESYNEDGRIDMML